MGVMHWPSIAIAAQEASNTRRRSAPAGEYFDRFEEVARFLARRQATSR
jgi:hypothetical protein